MRKRLLALALILALCLGLAVPAFAASAFNDVPEPFWARGNSSQAVRGGLAAGCADGGQGRQGRAQRHTAAHSPANSPGRPGTARRPSEPENPGNAEALSHGRPAPGENALALLKEIWRKIQAVPVGVPVAVMGLLLWIVGVIVRDLLSLSIPRFCGQHQLPKGF